MLINCTILCKNGCTTCSIEVLLTNLKWLKHLFTDGMSQCTPMLVLPDLLVDNLSLAVQLLASGKEDKIQVKSDLFKRVSPVYNLLEIEYTQDKKASVLLNCKTGYITEACHDIALERFQNKKLQIFKHWLNRGQGIWLG